ncbi:MAG TPA: thiamine pyrophosphate-dependent enzyme, partial [Armatimonadota bacterium]
VLDMVYNDAHATILILDNGITAMTGRQEHAGTGKTLDGVTAPQVDLEGLVRALGVQDVVVVDAYDLATLEAQLKRALAHPGPSVIIPRRPCMLIPHEERPLVSVQADTCRACGACLKIGCPAISKQMVEKNGKMRAMPVIDPLLCRGCGVCVQICPFDALVTADAPAQVGA